MTGRARPGSSRWILLEATRWPSHCARTTKPASAPSRRDERQRRQRDQSEPFGARARRLGLQAQRRAARSRSVGPTRGSGASPADAPAAPARRPRGESGRRRRAPPAHPAAVQYRRARLRPAQARPHPPADPPLHRSSQSPARHFAKAPFVEFRPTLRCEPSHSYYPLRLGAARFPVSPGRVPPRTPLPGVAKCHATARLRNGFDAREIGAEVTPSPSIEQTFQKSNVGASGD